MMRIIASAFLATLLSATLSAQEVINPPPGLEKVVTRLEALIDEAMKAHQIPAVSIALVEGGQIVWAKGFGFADPKAKSPATAETIYRVGSVSKLFTDLAVMQLVEQAKLDLDAPITTYLTDFAPRNLFNRPITLRQLMAHRSGLCRESPVGSYFDATSPSLEATVRIFCPSGEMSYG